MITIQSVLKIQLNIFIYFSTQAEFAPSIFLTRRHCLPMTPALQQVAFRWFACLDGCFCLFQVVELGSLIILSQSRQASSSCPSASYWLFSSWRKPNHLLDPLDCLISSESSYCLQECFNRYWQLYHASLCHISCTFDIRCFCHHSSASSSSRVLRRKLAPTPIFS